MLPLMRTGRRKERRVRKLMRRVTRGLGKLREADVLAELLNKVSDPTPDGRVGVGQLREQLQASHDRIFKKPKRRRLGRLLRRAVHQLEQLADGWADRGSSLERQWRRALDLRITMRVHGLLQAMDDAGIEAVPERVHRVRIAVKKLRYVVELAEELARTPPSIELRRLTRTQSLLGRLRDRQVLLGAGATVRASLARRNLRERKDLGELLTDLEAKCQRLHATYVRSRAGLHRVCQNLLARTPHVDMN
jgi:CHAD domain-containing protein